jgi:hypothetical protein
MVDLFSAILAPEIPRDHPTYAALLYAYCPAAAGWWKSGVALPPASYDVAWHVLLDYTTGADLRSVLDKYGLGKLLGPIKKYVHAVSDLRNQYPALQAPELLPIYDLVQTETSDRFGLHDPIREHFGGDWKNVFEYVRIWAFVIPDWTIQILHHNASDFSIHRQELTFRMPDPTAPIRFPAFVWRSGIRDPERPRIAFLSNGAVPDQMRGIVGLLSAPDDTQVWEVSPHIYLLDPKTGKVSPFEPTAPTERMLEILSGLAEASRSGPYPPLAALNNPDRCKPCPFNIWCLNPKIERPSLPLEMMEPGEAQAGTIR